MPRPNQLRVPLFISKYVMHITVEEIMLPLVHFLLLVLTHLSFTHYCNLHTYYLSDRSYTQFSSAITLWLYKAYCWLICPFKYHWINYLHLFLTFSLSTPFQLIHNPLYYHCIFSLSHCIIIHQRPLTLSYVTKSPTLVKTFLI